MNFINLTHKIMAENYYFILVIFLVLFIIVFFYAIYNKFYRIRELNLNSTDKFNSINKLKRLDIKYYKILYNVYSIIGSSISADKSEIFDEKYLLKLGEAKKIFYGVKRNKELIKSNYLLLKIFQKIYLYDIDKSEIDNTIIYLILLVLNKKK